MSNTAKYIDEKELINGLQSGAGKAYTILVERYHVKVIRTCKGFVHSLPDAEDIAQEVFIEVFKSISRFRGESELSTWIYRIAVNKSLNFLRKSKREKVLSFIIGATDDNELFVNDTAAGNESLPDRSMIRGEQANALAKTIESLPENQKTAFILHKYEDMAQKEIAEVMNISTGSVESLIYRAKQNLQKKLYRFYEKNMK